MHDLLQIMPDLALFCDKDAFLPFKTQQICRVKGRHYRDATIFQPVASQLGDAYHAHEMLQRHTTKQHNDLGLYQFNLTLQKWQAGLRFLLQGIAISGRPAFDDIGDIDTTFSILSCAVKAHGCDHIAKHLAGPADEGQPLPVFFLTGSFTDEHKPSLTIAVAANYMLTALI